MQINEFLKLIQRKKMTMLVIIMFFLSISIFLTIFQTFKYKATSRVLVVQDFSKNVSAYTMSKSNEYLGNLLAKVVESEIFYNEVINSGFNIDVDYFNRKGKGKQLKMWQDTVNARSTVGDNGIITINVYHPSRDQAKQIVSGINFILKTKNNDYHGLDESVFIKVIDKPLVSDWPVKPNIILNLLLSIILGVIIGLMYIYYFPEEENDLGLWKRKQKTKKINKENIIYEKENTNIEKNTKPKIDSKNINKNNNKEEYKKNSFKVNGSMDNILNKYENNNNRTKGHTIY